MELILQLLVVILLAYVLAEICKFIRIPRVVGQITAGLILSVPYIQSWVFTGQSFEILSFLADIGAILLFFFVGLEINILKFKENAAESAKISLLNTSIPFILGFVISIALGLNTIKATIVGVALSVSAQSISIDFLEEMKMMKSRLGQLIITAGAVDDIIELLLVSAVLAMIQTTIGNSNLLTLIGSILLFIVILVISKLYILPNVLTFFERGKDKTTLFTGALVITLLMAALSEKFGLGSLIGALLAGVLVRQILLAKGARMDEESITSTIHIISFGFLVPIFFVWIGLNTNLAGILDNLWFTLALTIIAFGGTIYGTMMGVLWSKGTAQEGYILGWGLNPKGDVELVIASLALQKQIIDVSLFSSLIFVALATTIVSPVVFRYLIGEYRKRNSTNAIEDIAATHAKKLKRHA